MKPSYVSIPAIRTATPCAARYSFVAGIEYSSCSCADLDPTKLQRFVRCLVLVLVSDLVSDGDGDGETQEII